MCRNKSKASVPSRPFGYTNSFQAYWYGLATPLYDMFVWFCMLPLGGERAVRRQIVDWVRPLRGQRLLSLCCGTGSQDRAILSVQANTRIVAIDLGPGQLARARKKDPAGRIDYRLADAARTSLRSNSFDRVLVAFALHEMPRGARARVLQEAERVCKRDGLAIAVEHGVPRSGAATLLRWLWWFHWVPGNPEVSTTRDLQVNGLDREMAQAGLDVVARHSGKYGWVQGVVARPSRSLPALPHDLERNEWSEKPSGRLTAETREP